MEKIVVMGVGNLLLTDEGAGIHAVHKLENLISDKRVRVIDGGTMGLDLLPVIEEADLLYIIDCVKGGEPPGTVYRFGPDEIRQKMGELKLSLHDFNLVDVLNLARALNKHIPEIIIFGIEPASLDWGLEPTPEVARSIDRVVQLVLEELMERLKEENNA